MELKTAVGENNQGVLVHFWYLKVREYTILRLESAAKLYHL